MTDDIVARLRSADLRDAAHAAIEAADEITRLRADLAAAITERDVYERLSNSRGALLVSAQADLAAAREALKPFAKECDRLVTADNMPEQVLRPTITAGELRCARAALKGGGG